LTIVEIQHGLHLAEPTDGYVRTPGLHASQIYGSYYQSTNPKRYDKRDAAGEPLGFDLARMEFGTSFEEALEEALISPTPIPLMERTRQRLAHRLLGKRPGEFTSPEGVIFSPDYLFDEPDGSMVLGEFKLTWMSGKNAPDPLDERYSKWHTQMMLYCRWLEITRARLFAFFVNGGKAKPYHEHTPELSAWEICYTQRELDQNWNTMERHARKVGLLPVKETR
jgi:hypothetical protein